MLSLKHWPLSQLLWELGIPPPALTWIKYELVTALCCGDMKSIPTQKNCCRTFGYSWRSLTSTLQTPLPLMGSCVHHTKKSRDKTHASYKQVYLHFDWSTDSRYRFLLHNSTRASAKYAFFIHVQKTKNQQIKRQRVWQYLLTTGMPQPPIDPPPLTLVHHADFVVSISCLEWLHCQWREVTP